MKRLEHIDSLRGFALLLILLLHSHSKFGLNIPPDDEIMQLHKLDSLVKSFSHIFISNKAFALFSIMFGFSFLLQVEKSSGKAINFRTLFTRRLILLLCIGYLNSLVFTSDILTKYALAGFVILLVYRFDTRIIAGLALLMLIQIPEIVRIFRSINDSSYQVPDFRNASLWDQIRLTGAEGSFIQLIKLNAWSVFVEIWKLNFTTGRFFQILGYFFIGILIGKSGLLNTIEKHKKTFLFLIAGSALLYILLGYLRSLFHHADWTGVQTTEMITHLLTSYMNIFMVISILSAFLIAFQYQLFQPILMLLAPYGRMSLTSYLAQGFLGVFLFYGFGLGLYQYLDTFLSLLTGVGILIILLIFSHFWLKYYYYGPVEWLWRSLTYRRWDIPLRKQKT